MFVLTSVGDDKRDNREYERNRIGGRHRSPHSVYSEMSRKNHKEGEQEYKLTCQRKENRDFGTAHRLEVILNHNLASHKRIEYEEYSESALRYGDKCRIDCEKPGYDTGPEFGENPSGGGYGDSKPYTYGKGMAYALEIFRAIVESQNRLHTLCDAKHNHHEKHRGAVENAICAYGHIAVGASVVKQSLVDEHHHYACADVHQKRRKAYGIYALYNHGRKPFVAPTEMNEALL